MLGAGSGKRFGATTNKVVVELNNRPMYDYALKLFIEDARCEHILFVVQDEDQVLIKEQIDKGYGSLPSKLSFIQGGSERQYSVKNALAALRFPKDGYLLVHDAARPFVDQDMIDQLFEAVKEEDAVLFAVPAKDTIKVVRNGEVHQTLHRPVIWQVQTPQAYKSELLIRAYEQAFQEEYLGNEEGELVERLNHPVKAIEGKDRNFKITSVTDFEIAAALMRR
nr:2-C-methyl-D-erythritol 4-phosphate cytidylyltransferase [Marinilactibacillus kalidii]